MLQSRYFTKTSKAASKDDVSANARLLEQAGFVFKNSAGIYTYLPLGWRVLQKIARIIREEMDAIGSVELFMPALHDKHYLQATGRWDVDVIYKVMSGQDTEPTFNISWTHEEIITEIASRFVSSYKDLPFAAYQIQTKFRHEPRAKSGLLRGREFIMKDLYSFHATEEDFWKFYERVANAYHRVFERCGLQAVYTLAAGGDFTVNNTHEFQVLSPVGEDTIFVCAGCGYAINAEIHTADRCPKCSGVFKSEKAIEVGNIFPLGTKYSEAFNLKYTDRHGQQQYVVMGSYGIGLGRVMGTVVEVLHDEQGIIWPRSLAPFAVHLLQLDGAAGSGEVSKRCREVYEHLLHAGIEVLYDDRPVRPGVKFADSDLMGIPYRAVISDTTIVKKFDQCIELVERNAKRKPPRYLGTKELVDLLRA